MIQNKKKLNFSQIQRRQQRTQRNAVDKEVKMSLFFLFINNGQFAYFQFKLIQLQQMGNQFTVSSERPKAGYLDDWETIDHLENYNLVRNIKTGDLGQSRKYRVDSLYSPSDQIKIYELRRNTDEPIVKAYSYQLLDKVSKRFRKQKDISGVCASNNYLGVVTEHIPISLQHLPNLNFIECLYILSQSLKGFQYLFPKTGPVNVTPRMIGFNSKGQVKVWINGDYSQNHPIQQIPSLLTTRNLKPNGNNQQQKQYTLIQPQYRQQKQFVENVVDIVEQKCQTNGLPQQFARQIRINQDSFIKVLWYIDHFCGKYKLTRPTNLMHRVIQSERNANDFVFKDQNSIAVPKLFEINSHHNHNHNHSNHQRSHYEGNINQIRNYYNPVHLSSLQNNTSHNNGSLKAAFSPTNEVVTISQNNPGLIIPNPITIPNINSKIDHRYSLNPPISSKQLIAYQQHPSTNNSLSIERNQFKYNTKEFMNQYVHPQPETINYSGTTTPSMIKFNYRN